MSYVFGVVLVILGEILNSSIIGHQSTLVMILMVPIYFLFLILIDWIRNTYDWSLVMTAVFGGIMGFFIIEYGFLRHVDWGWPMQLFLLCFWIAIISFQLLIRIKKYEVILLPATSSLIVFLVVLLATRQFLLTELIAWVTFSVVAGVGNVWTLYAYELNGQKRRATSRS